MWSFFQGSICLSRFKWTTKKTCHSGTGLRACPSPAAIAKVKLRLSDKQTLTTVRHERHRIEIP